MRFCTDGPWLVEAKDGDCSERYVRPGAAVEFDAARRAIVVTDAGEPFELRCVGGAWALTPLT